MGGLVQKDHGLSREVSTLFTYSSCNQMQGKPKNTSVQSHNVSALVFNKWNPYPSNGMIYHLHCQIQLPTSCLPDVEGGVLLTTRTQTNKHKTNLLLHTITV